MEHDAGQLISFFGIGADNDDVVATIFLQPQILSFLPGRHILPQHEILPLDDIEHSFSSNPCMRLGLFAKKMRCESLDQGKNSGRF
jgi:hypothetical protein